MKKHNFKRLLSLVLTLCIMASLAIPVFALDSDNTSIIDPNMTGTIHIHKIDFTNAAKDGVWNTSYVSTGRQDSELEQKLITNVVRAGDDDNDGIDDLGNGLDSHGYAIRGVEFTYLKVADIATFSKPYTKEDGTIVNNTMVVYGFNIDAALPMLRAIGLDSSNRYVPADAIAPNNSTVYFESDVLVNALRESLAANATTVKDALEGYITTHGGTAMNHTDEYGHTSVSGLPLGLYLIVETKIPEMVTNTTNPFFISVPSTSIDGGGAAGGLTSSNITDGGEVWMYEMHLYPKNETGIPSLEKTVRESQGDTGNNNASTTITDGFKHTATGSTGDIMEYQIVTTLPAITSDATELAELFWFDTLNKGQTYTKGDVKIEFFTDTACATTPIDTWTETNINSTNFAVTYIPNETNDAESTAMSIKFTEAGLDVVNNSSAVYTSGTEVRRGYSDCTIRITYTAKIDSNNTVTFGDTGNENTVVLTWRRSSQNYYDTLVDDCHVYTYGIDLTKYFEGENGNPAIDGDYAEVEFVLYNDTDDYWVKAELNQAEGIYYVVDHMISDADSKPVSSYDGVHGNLDAEAEALKAGATQFIPVTSDGVDGKIIIKGLEDDEYILTEIKTDSGYTLLKDHIKINISTAENTVCPIYTTDKKGVMQNDARYLEVLNRANVNLSTVLGLGNTIPQKYLEHKVLTASATVDGNDVTMLTDNASVNALVALDVVNTHGFDLPQTGDTSARWLQIGGPVVMALSVVGIISFFVVPMFVKRKEEDAE